MMAIEEALNLEDSKLGYVLLIDSIDYAIWVMILLMIVPFSNRFNRWSGADGILPKIYDNKNSNRKELNFQNCFLVFSLSLVISSISLNMASHLPTSTFFTKTAWSVLLATIFGLLAGITPLNRESSASTISNIMLYMIIALIASRADIFELTKHQYIYLWFCSHYYTCSTYGYLCKNIST